MLSFSHAPASPPWQVLVPTEMARYRHVGDCVREGSCSNAPAPLLPPGQLLETGDLVSPHWAVQGACVERLPNGHARRWGSGWMDDVGGPVLTELRLPAKVPVPATTSLPKHEGRATRTRPSSSPAVCRPPSECRTPPSPYKNDSSAGLTTPRSCLRGCHHTLVHHHKHQPPPPPTPFPRRGAPGRCLPVTGPSFAGGGPSLAGSGTTQ